jgi:L-proline amide hydrolase
MTGFVGQTMRWDGFETWYRVVGELSAATTRAPLVVCHGGPGLTHDYLSSVAELSASGRACILYDQFGNGRSGRRPEAPVDFWSVELFLRELRTLVSHLGIGSGYHVLGHSWGGMLALELALDRPAGLRSIVLADAFASSADYRAGVVGLLEGLPPEVRETIERHETAGTTDTPEYQQAMRVFYGRHVCRRRPVPDEVMRTLGALGADSTVYEAMMGPSEFRMTGTLRDWDVHDRLGTVAVPALLVSGRHDEVTPDAVEPLYRGLPDARWSLFEDSSHMPHVEEPERFRAEVGGFLDGVDEAVVVASLTAGRP